MSSIRSVVLPMRNGLRYRSTAGLHQFRALREGGAAVTVEPILVGRDLHHGEPRTGGLTFNHTNVFDLGSGHPARSASGLILCFLLSCGYQTEQSGGSEILKRVRRSSGMRPLYSRSPRKRRYPTRWQRGHFHFVPIGRAGCAMRAGGLKS